MSKPSLRSVVVALLLWTGAANLYASPQRLSGDIEGVVKDASGALIPSVSITVTNVETAAERMLITDEYGHFLAALLPVGEYAVRAQLQGFGTWTGRVVAKTGERTNINIILQVGNVSEEVTIQTSAAQLVNASDAQIAMSIDEKRVKELPLATRDPLVLATLLSLIHI